MTLLPISYTVSDILNCVMKMDKQGWNLLYESSPVILPLLLRAACALKQVTIHRTL